MNIHLNLMTRTNVSAQAAYCGCTEMTMCEHKTDSVGLWDMWSVMGEADLITCINMSCSVCVLWLGERLWILIYSTRSMFKIVSDHSPTIPFAFFYSNYSHFSLLLIWSKVINAHSIKDSAVWCYKPHGGIGSETRSVPPLTALCCNYQSHIIHTISLSPSHTHTLIE